MKNEKYKYELLSDELKKNLLEKLTARYFFERRTDHGRKALIFLLSCEPKKKSRWKRHSLVVQGGVPFVKKYQC